MSTATESVQNVNESPAEQPARGGNVYRPIVDIIENKDELLILANMPGTSPQDIDVKFEDGNLTIHGRVKARQNDGTQYLLQEYGVGDFYRAFQVGESVDASRISAELTDGVLKLHLPKVEAVKPRMIHVQVH